MARPKKRAYAAGEGGTCETVTTQPIRVLGDFSSFEEADALGISADAAAVEVVLAPDGMLACGGPLTAEATLRRYRDLAVAIRQRIETRLPGRIRNLTVRITGSTIFLQGECSTFHSKQLAQHAVLGVLEDEHLSNCIAVCVES